MQVENGVGGLFYNVSFSLESVHIPLLHNYYHLKMYFSIHAMKLMDGWLAVVVYCLIASKHIKT